MKDNLLVHSRIVGPKGRIFRSKCETYGQALDYWLNTPRYFPKGTHLVTTPFTLHGNSFSEREVISK